MSEVQLWSLVSLASGTLGGLLGTVVGLKSIWRRSHHCPICERP